MNAAVRSGVAPLHITLSGLTATLVAGLAILLVQAWPAVQWPPHITVALSPLPTAPAIAPAPPFVLATTNPADRANAEHCLAQAVYYEAGFQPPAGQRAIAQVVLNRVRDRNFPSTICGVVYQGWRRRTGCQFSFVCDGSLWRRPPTAEEMASAEQVARQALGGYVEASVGTATHYHSWRVSPDWTDTLIQTARIGDHIFYRWPGNAGRPQALAARGDDAGMKLAEFIPHVTGRSSRA